ncbi:LytR/AlgR family response regulator transcription factor [Pontibacter silvestris]|uniref:LytR/AlgR family response regulator transcription factor n=1 Tax=Pontibacter silvestris TaxID=2305183 RepID=A0ABW4X1Z1_9BACT|nr:LytTR family DNA-binding domain-containing protein [Pontibacter silvestris]MCC9136099.1 LytTR family DNA-binding domain-containing protein [Pontibacter silvestris]
MALRCVAVDDEPLALKIINEYISRIPALELVQTFEDAIAASEFLNNTSIDILLVDVNMPDISGIDLVRSLKDKPLVIFTTAYKSFAYEGFELQALDYLLKPIDFDRFSKAVRKAIDYVEYKKTPREEAGDSLYVYSEYRLVKIELNNIEYIESLEDYIKIHVAEGRAVLSLMSMKKVLEKLPAGRFRRIHRSFTVPVDKVVSIQNRKALLSSGKELPISNSYSNFIQDWKKC